MAEARMGLSAFLSKLLKEQDGGVLREAVRVLAQAVMETEVTALVGAERDGRADRAGREPVSQRRAADRGDKAACRYLAAQVGERPLTQRYAGIRGSLARDALHLNDDVEGTSGVNARHAGHAEWRHIQPLLRLDKPPSRRR